MNIYVSAISAASWKGAISPKKIIYILNRKMNKFNCEKYKKEKKSIASWICLNKFDCEGIIKK